MSCNDMKESLVLLVDGELDEAEAEIVKKHIADCKECKSEYEKLIFMKKASRKEYAAIEKIIGIKEDIHPELQTPHKNIIGWRNLGMKRKAAAVLAAVLLIAAFFTPFGGRSMAKNMGEWFKKISFVGNKENVDNEGSFTYNYISDIDPEEIESHLQKISSFALIKEVYEERDKKLMEINNISDRDEYEKRAAEIRKEAREKIKKIDMQGMGISIPGYKCILYKNVEEARKKSEMKIPMPQYIPGNMSLSDVSVSGYPDAKTIYKSKSACVEYASDIRNDEEYNKNNYEFVRLYVGYQPYVENEKFYLEHEIREKNPNMSEKDIKEMVDNNFKEERHTTHFSENVKLKPFSMNGYDGYELFNKSRFDDTYKLVLCVKIDKESFSAQGEFRLKENSDSVIKNVENELRKTLESCLK